MELIGVTRTLLGSAAPFNFRRSYLNCSETSNLLFPATDILNKQPRTTGKGWSSSLWTEGVCKQGVEDI
jgi:hypothetical protein